MNLSRSIAPSLPQIAGWEITFVRTIAFPFITACHLGGRVSPAILLTRSSMKAQRPRDTIVCNTHFRSTCGIFGCQPQPFPGSTGSVLMKLKTIRGDLLLNSLSQRLSNLLVHDSKQLEQ